ncbi:MAG: hypothetical protein KDD43_01590, partial [Bdellovibrionales bacterium]|nr:hypothetical protein [Bdellovibrionales bacterium]
WRLFSISDPKGYWIQVAQRLEVRSELTNEIAEHSMQAPLFIALLLAGAIWLIIGKAFRPLQTISQAVAERHIGHLSPIDIANTPTEVQALILAINRLLARVKEQALSERRFTADAAHELRTPLAAMKIQLQNGLRRIEGGKAAHSLNQSLKALDRMTHLVEQLLLLSRLDASEVIDTPDIVVLSQTVQDVLDEYQHVINARNIRVQVEESSHPEVTAHSALIHTLIKNFIDNALRYTPDSELLRIKIEKNILIIEDSGPGIPLEQQSKVFSRFYRVEGDHSKGEGLGLAICEKIADLYGYRIQLENIPPPGSGLRVLLFFSPVFK